MTSAKRSNAEWVRALGSAGPDQAQAIADLRDLLLRAALFTLNRDAGDLYALDHRERLAFAEDCAQEALLAVLARLPDFRGDSQFTTWAFKFAVNTAHSSARRERWKRANLAPLEQDAGAVDWVARLQDLAVSGAELPALQREVWTVVQDVIQDELTPRQRQVLKLMVLDDVPMDVVVERLGANRNAVYKLLHDARQKVRRRLAARGFEVADILRIFER